MKLRLKSPHLVNGREFAAGTVLTFKPATAQALIAVGVAEPFTESAKPAAKPKAN